MQDTTRPTAEPFHADPSVTTWWAPSLPAGAHPTQVDIPREAIEPPPPPAEIGVTITLMVLGLVFAPFAWACWAYSSTQLRLIDTGERSTAGRGAIEIARAVAVGVTVLGLVLMAALVLRS